METALLSGDSSGSGGGGSGPLGSSGDALSAEDGVGIPEEILDQSSFASAAKLYFIFTRFDFLWSLNYFALIVLNFLEKPLWCSKQSAYACSNREYYFLGQLPYLTNTESLVYEVRCYSCNSCGHMLYFPISYEGFQRYTGEASSNRLKVLLLHSLHLFFVRYDTQKTENWCVVSHFGRSYCCLVLVADLVVYVLSIAGLYYLPFRAAPYVRVVFFILNIRYGL
nr:two pore calcium channel protein 1A-like [Ipomoea batatas]